MNNKWCKKCSLEKGDITNLYLPHEKYCIDCGSELSWTKINANDYDKDYQRLCMDWAYRNRYRLYSPDFLERRSRIMK